MLGTMPMPYHRRGARQLLGLVQDRAQRQADVQYRRYVRPGPSPTTHVVEPVEGGGELIVSGPRASIRPGAIVPTARELGAPSEVLLAYPPPGRSGVAVNPPDERAATLPAYGLTGCDPDDLPAGASTPVALSGYGLSEGDAIEAVALVAGEWEADPLVTVSGVVILSAEAASALIAVDATAPADYPVGLEVER